MNTQERKVVVIGAGFVGTTYVYALMHTGLVGEIVLIDLDQKRLKGEVMDLEHGLTFIQPVEIRAGDYSDCTDANLIVVTAGAKQTPGQSRLELIQRNADIVKSICDEIKKYGSEAVLVMVANPVDALTQVALKRLDWPRERVIGSGTVLDSARFRSTLSRHCDVDTRNVHAYILGEHGDSEVAAEYGSESAAVTLDGQTSYDPDGDIVSYIWKEGEVVLGNEAVTEATLSIGTHDISLTVTDNDALSSTDAMQVVVTQKAPSGPVIYVQDIKMSAKRKGKTQTVTAEVTIFDDSNNPVGSADVLGSWSGSVNQNVSAVTFSKGKKRVGKAKFTLSGIREAGDFTFTVTDVAKSGMTCYDALNVETSDTIVIP